jgi:hypothetical protein
VTQHERDRDDLIDVRHAATLVRRHPETIRRWVWSGRLAARRQGRRLLVVPSEVEAVARQDVAASSLREWADRARAVGTSMRPGASTRSAADLVIEDRLARSGLGRDRARR